jgi:hypothetical protein
MKIGSTISVSNLLGMRSSWRCVISKAAHLLAIKALPAIPLILTSPRDYPFKEHEHEKATGLGPYYLHQSAFDGC